jgi:hypothetical protein
MRGCRRSCRERVRMMEMSPFVLGMRTDEGNGAVRVRNARG